MILFYIFQQWWSYKKYDDISVTSSMGDIRGWLRLSQHQRHETEGST